MSDWMEDEMEYVMAKVVEEIYSAVMPLRERLESTCIIKRCIRYLRLAKLCHCLSETKALQCQVASW